MQPGETIKRLIYLLSLAALVLLVSCQSSTPEPETAVVPTPTAASPAETPETETETAVASEPAEEEIEVVESEPEPVAELDPFKTGTNGYPWWNDTVFYEIFVRSFYDSDGDGIGDINGIIEKLDYLNDGDPTTSDDLGITGIWLMPIKPSPSYHGYDVIDYYGINPEYGTMEDFKRFLDEAHARGIHVVIDFVMNHTALDHPWFEASRDATSEKRDWYLWEDENPGWRGPDGQVVWHSSPDGYYYGVFWGGMPDLNVENPDVTAELYNIAEFWLTDVGVDGFRLDAIKHMVENGQLQENTFETHDWMEGFFTFYKSVDPTAFTVGEAWTSTQQVVDYTGDEVDIAFQFDLALDILNGADAGVASIFTKTQIEVVEAFPPLQYATFITNHDQNRVMSQLDEDWGKARVAAGLLLTAPGVPFVYYGEEIGQLGTKPDEDIRLPMQWDASDGAGFTTGTPWRPPFPDYREKNVAAQMDDPDSLFNVYRDLIQLRNQHEALRVGDWTLVEPNSSRLYTFLRQTENETILVMINMNRNLVEADSYSLDLPLDGTTTAVSLYGLQPASNPEVGSGYIPFDEVPAQSVHIMQLVPEE